MMNVYAFIVSILGPLVIKIIAAAGFTAVTYTGVTLLMNQLISSAQGSWSAMPVAVLQLLTLSGIPAVMGLIFGAYAARVTMWAAGGAAKYVLKS